MNKDLSFIDFSFNGITAESLGIKRVSNGDRYDEGLHPEINDITSEVSGRDGIYYFGTNYGAKPISVSFAYDDLTEAQFREIRRVFSPKKQGRLIFSESPYKTYLAKVKNPIEMNYVCFDEPNYIWITDSEKKGVMGQPYEYKQYTGTTRRTYKGEGTIEFVCYYPFAKSTYKILPFSYQLTEDVEIQEGKKYYKLEGEEYVLVSEPDVSEISTYYETVTDEASEEWAVSSGLLTNDEYTGEFDIYKNQQFKVYNPGDISTGFCLYIPKEDIPVVNPNVEPENITFVYKKNGIDVLGTLVIKPMTLDESETGIIIDTDNQTITSVKTNTALPGKLYNECVVAGFFFRLEPDDIEAKTGSIIEISEDLSHAEISYNYLYL